jgi:aspartokinase
VETIAVYWESQIKTYGLNEFDGLAHVQFACPPEQMAPVGQLVREMEEPGMRMLLVVGQAAGDGLLGLGLLIGQQWEKGVMRKLRGLLGEEADSSLHSISPVSLIFLHGPHFGDRYGIADAAVGALTKKGIPIVALGCTASSIYLVMPEDQREAAGRSLKEAFLMPSS